MHDAARDAVSPLLLYNTRTRTKAPFRPLVAGRVSLYVCGMTVYDYCHVGHARVMTFFDVVVRHLRLLGYAVDYVRNITDIDDKIIRRANENGEPFQALTERFIAALHEDAAALGIEPPTREPRAAGSIAAIIALIERLEARGLAYRAANGDVYFRVRAFPAYGRLAGRALEELPPDDALAASAAAKQDPLDFALWKAAKPDEPRWASPWGEGRPGWHIECSAMSTAALGNRIDIHGGGMDLIFPHHENEIAQSEGATGEPFVNCWMHVGFVRVDDDKMSKSLGNFFTIREVLQKCHPETVRYLLLAAHYRSPLNYSEENLANARAALARLYTALRGAPDDVADGSSPGDGAWEARWLAAMNDDFNTPEALAVLFDLAREINRRREQRAEVAGHAALLRRLGGHLGLLRCDPDAFLRAGEGGDDGEIEGLIAQRARARAERAWAEADRIRAQLEQRGVLLEDADGKTTWRRA